MRKQYHFRPSAEGLRAWDVDRLVKLSSNLPVISLPIKKVQELHEPYWFAEDQRATCEDIIMHARLIQETDLKYPIILCSSGRVMDGMHRVCKAVLQGEEFISAVRLEEDPQPDFVGISPKDLPY